MDPAGPKFDQVTGMAISAASHAQFNIIYDYDTQNGSEVRVDTGVVVSDLFSAYFAPLFRGARRLC